MRIGIDARELGGRTTGVGRYLAELLARWTRAEWAQGHTLILFSPDGLDPTAAWLGIGGASWAIDPVPGAGGTWWEQRALAAAARAARLDVFFAPAYTAPVTLRIPTVVTVHDVSFSARPEWFRRREGLRRRLLTRRAALEAAAIITVSSFSRDGIVRCLGIPADRITVIPQAVDAHPALLHDMAVPSAGLAGSPGVCVLYVGSIFNRRHVPELIEAFCELALTRSELRLELIGADRTWPPQEIGGCIRASRVAGQIGWRPWVGEPQLRALYDQARVMAFLSEYEGFGFTPLEALAAGVPALVADVAVAHEVYGDAAVFVDPTSPPAIAEALRTLLDDEPTRTRILEAAPSVIARYSWDISAARTFEVLRRAASKAVMTAPTSLDIVIVSFNAREALQACLASLRDAPPRRSRSVIVVDNASTDGSPEVVESTLPEARLIRLDENVGFARATNVGIRAGRGPVLLLLNSDTVMTAGALDSMVETLETTPGVAALGPRLVDWQSRPELSFGRMITPWNELRQKVLGVLSDRDLWVVGRLVDRLTSRPRQVDWVSGACLLVYRADAEAVGLLDERYFLYAEDVDFCAALRARGRMVLFSPITTVVHTRGVSRKAAPAAAQLAYRRSQIAFYAKHHPTWSPWLARYLRLKGAWPGPGS